jgi:hypothetical protein
MDILLLYHGIHRFVVHGGGSQLIGIKTMLRACLGSVLATALVVERGLYLSWYVDQQIYPQAVL